MRRITVGATAAVIIALTIVVWATPAGACSCIATSDEQALESADAAFSGTLVEILPPAAPTGSSADPARFVFEVDEVFKGEVQARQAVVTPVSGASCGLELSGLGPFLVFASTGSSLGLGVEEGELSSTLCSGSRLLAGGDLSETFGRSSRPEGGADAQDDAGGVRAGPVIGLAVVAAGVARGRRATQIVGSGLTLPRAECGGGSAAAGISRSPS